METIVYLTAATFLIFFGSMMNIKSGGFIAVLLYKLLPISLGLAVAYCSIN